MDGWSVCYRVDVDGSEEVGVGACKGGEGIEGAEGEQMIGRRGGEMLWVFICEGIII